MSYWKKNNTLFLDERKFKLCRTHRKTKFSFSNSATYFFEAWFSCTQIYENMYRGLEVLNVIFGFLPQKILPEPICKVLASLEVIFCTKKLHFLMLRFRALSRHMRNPKNTIFWKLLGVTSSNFQNCLIFMIPTIGESLKKIWEVWWHFHFFLSDLIWNYPNLNLVNTWNKFYQKRRRSLKNWRTVFQ